jgi:quercetin dioxygenase-like cupin family protein
MKKSLTMPVIAALLLVASLAVARAQKELSKDHATYVSSSNAEFKENARAAGGVSSAVVYGDPDKGPHATFTKFKPGYDAGMHYHTNDTRIVVIKGAYLYKDEDGEKRVGPGDFLLVPGGHKHWSGGDKKEGALFYQDGPGKFDLIPVK